MQKIHHWTRILNCFHSESHEVLSWYYIYDLFSCFIYMHIYYVMFAIKSMVRAYFVFCLSRKITLIESIFNEKELHVLNELIFQRDTIAYVKLLTGVQETYKYVILRYIFSTCILIISTEFFLKWHYLQPLFAVMKVLYILLKKQVLN